MYKTESINETLSRIAKQELGLKIDPNERKFIGQYVGKFKTENNRQDISTCYAVKISDFDKIKINEQHFFEKRLIVSANEIPKNTGAMYKYYLEKFFDN